MSDTKTPKKYYEVDSPEILDDDGGDRGAIAAKELQTLGPRGLSRFFAVATSHMVLSAEHFTAPDSDPERLHYVQHLRMTARIFGKLGEDFAYFSRTNKSDK